VKARLLAIALCLVVLVVLGCNLDAYTPESTPNVAACSPNLLSGAFGDLQRWSGACSSPEPTMVSPQSLDPAAACAADPDDDDCVACAKTSCCEVFVTCYAEHCTTPNPAEETCLDKHCAEECAAR
jgi:hypothetical protein